MNKSNVRIRRLTSETRRYPCFGVSVDWHYSRHLLFIVWRRLKQLTHPSHSYSFTERIKKLQHELQTSSLGRLDRHVVFLRANFFFWDFDRRCIASLDMVQACVENSASIDQSCYILWDDVIFRRGLPEDNDGSKRRRQQIGCSAHGWGGNHRLDLVWTSHSLLVWYPIQGRQYPRPDSWIVGTNHYWCNCIQPSHCFWLFFVEIHARRVWLQRSSAEDPG